MSVVTPPLPSVHAPETARAGLNTFFSIAEQWGLTRAEQATLLGVRSTTTVDNWRKRSLQTLSADTLERMSYLLHIYRSLHQIFPAERADEWIRRPSSAAPFFGQTALEYLLQGQVRHLLDVHRHLKGAASGVF